MGISDIADWVKFASQGDQEAGEKIYLLLRMSILPWIERHAPSRLDPEDLFHDTILIIWKKLNDLRAVDSVTAYALRVAKSVLLRELRGFERHPLLHLGDRSSSVDPQLTNLEREELLVSILSMLNTQQRELFLIFYRDGASNPDARRLLRISDGLLRLRKFEMRKAAQWAASQFLDGAS